MSNIVHTLAEQAAQVSAETPNELELQVEYEGKTYSVPANFIEAFAELIVRECCSKLVEMGESWREFAMNPPDGQARNASAALFAAYRLKEDAVDEIQQHFGVEE